MYVVTARTAVPVRFMARCLWLIIVGCIGVFGSGCTRLHYPARWDAGPFPGFNPQSRTDSAIERLPQPGSPPAIRRVLAFARKRIGSRRPLIVDHRRYRFDCSGYVNAAFASAGIDLNGFGHPSSSHSSQGNTAALFRQVRRHGIVFKRHPRPGDLVFFDNTWDRNGDGRLNDALTHMGIVSRVDPDGTIEILHLDNSGIGVLRMNLDKPDERTDPQSGRVINNALRRRRRNDPPGTPYLASQLFRAFGRFPLEDEHR